jgi:hypothetical protein
MVHYARQSATSVPSTVCTAPFSKANERSHGSRRILSPTGAPLKVKANGRPFTRLQLHIGRAQESPASLVESLQFHPQMLKWVILLLLHEQFRMVLLARYKELKPRSR